MMIKKWFKRKDAKTCVLIKPRNIAIQFQSCRANQNTLFVDKNKEPVIFLESYYYEPVYELFEVGRRVTIWEDGVMKVIFEENSNCQGSEQDVERYIFKLTGQFYEMKIKDYEEHVNSQGRMSWIINGKQYCVGSHVTVKQYQNRSGSEYPDLEGKEAVIVYRFGKNEPHLQFVDLGNAATRGRIFKDGIHIATIYTAMDTLPLTEFVSIA